jgi:hypothetical protein
MLKRNKPAYRYCPNCHFPLPSFGNFCSHCGQKYTDGKITVGTLLKEFVTSVLNIDAKIFRTLRDLFIPGKLTAAYFKGQQKRYVPPVRLFFVMSVIHFAVLGTFGIEKLAQQVLKLRLEFVKKAYYADYRDEVDSTMLTVKASLPDDPLVVQTLDSMSSILPDTRRDSFGVGYPGFDEQGKIIFHQQNFTIRDLIELPIDSLVAKSGADNIMGQTIVRQTAKFYREGDNFTRYILSNLIWMAVLMMPALALLLKLLYIRRNRYYVEHLVFSFHYHAFAFLIFTVLLIINGVEWFSLYLPTEALLLVGSLGVLLYLYFAMRKYYQQTRIKTFLKYWIINFAYVLIFSLFLSLTIIIGTLMY